MQWQLAASAAAPAFRPVQPDNFSSQFAGFTVSLSSLKLLDLRYSTVLFLPASRAADPAAEARPAAVPPLQPLQSGYAAVVSLALASFRCLRRRLAGRVVSLRQLSFLLALSVAESMQFRGAAAACVLLAVSVAVNFDAPL